MCHWQDAGRNRCRGAAGGTAGRVFEVPGIVAGTVEPGFGIRVQAKPGARATAHKDESSLFAARDVGGLVIGDKILEEVAAKCRGLTAFKEKSKPNFTGA